MTQLLIGVINQVAFPAFSKIQTDINLLPQTFLQAIRFTSLIAFPVFFGLLTLTPEIIITLFGKQWTPSILVLQILIFSGILSSFFSCMGAIFLTLGKSYLQFFLTLITIILSVTLACFLIKWGIIAVAFAFVFSSYLIFPFALWMLIKLISISLKEYLQQFITPLISSLIMILAILSVKYFLAMYFNTIILLIICTIVASLTYTISILQIKAIFSKQNLYNRQQQE
ncbi:lipopolysaccharide biosynthesis protein WzxC [Geminocystis sp. NIES-3708]|nr:lipopolysaccharide biosynthesis protein WzxC [Geminocystis sp. NIES-3708]